MIQLIIALTLAFMAWNADAHLTTLGGISWNVPPKNGGACIAPISFPPWPAGASAVSIPKGASQFNFPSGVPCQ